MSDGMKQEARNAIRKSGFRNWRNLRAHLSDHAMSSALPISLLAKFIADKIPGDDYLRCYIADRLAEKN